VSRPGATPIAVAGNGKQGYSGEGGPATGASLCQPRGVAVDYYRNLFISDSCNNVIRKVSASTQTIATIAGTGVAGMSAGSGAALESELHSPWGIAVGSDGMIYFGDQVVPYDANIRVMELTPPIARITSPAPGSIIPATSVTFNWADTSAGSEFTLEIADSQGDIFFNGSTTATSQTVSDLPCDGRILYVKLQTYIGGQWLNPARYTYHACPMTIIATPSTLSQQGGAVTLKVNATNIWSTAAALSVSESVSPMICARTVFGSACPRPTPVGTTAEIPLGSSTATTYSPLQIGSIPTFYQLAVTHVFVATLTVGGTAVFSSSANVTQW
jgi:hypothetical protein